MSRVSSRDFFITEAIWRNGIGGQHSATLVDRYRESRYWSIILSYYIFLLLVVRVKWSITKKKVSCLLPFIYNTERACLSNRKIFVLSLHLLPNFWCHLASYLVLRGCSFECCTVRLRTYHFVFFCCPPFHKWWWLACARQVRKIGSCVVASQQNSLLFFSKASQKSYCASRKCNFYSTILFCSAVHQFSSFFLDLLVSIVF